jgi:hypothetical protein
MEALGFCVCIADLEDGLIRALGAGSVEQIIGLLTGCCSRPDRSASMRLWIGEREQRQLTANRRHPGRTLSAA